MCAMSMIMQNHLDYYDKTGTIQFYKLVDEYILAKKKDAEEGQPDCEHQDKLDRIHQITGIDLSKY